MPANTEMLKDRSLNRAAFLKIAERLPKPRLCGRSASLPIGKARLFTLYRIPISSNLDSRTLNVDGGHVAVSSVS